MNIWVVMIAGHMVAPGWFSDAGDGHARCIARAAEVDGACERLPDPPAAHTPEYKEWHDTYCWSWGVYSIPPHGHPCGDITKIPDDSVDFSK